MHPAASAAEATLFAVLLLICGGGTLADLDQAQSVEFVKEKIKALYMNMDSPEISPGDTAGALNVSLGISQLLHLQQHQLELSFTLEMRWRHKFLEMLDETMEAIPLDRRRIWTPKFVFVNVRSVREDQSSLYLQLAGSLTRAIVYRVWHRSSIRCDGPSIQHPFGDTLCSLVFEEANPHSSRSVHMTLADKHQKRCSHRQSLGRSFLYRISKPFSDDGRQYQLWTRICIRSSLQELTPALRQYCLSLILVLTSLSTVYFFDRSTRLFVNLALLHILIFNWAPLGHRINAVDIWNAQCACIVCCCLLAALAAAASGDDRGGHGGTGADSHSRHGRCSHNGTFLLQKDFGGGGGGPRASKCTTISESSDHLDNMFDTRRSPGSDSGAGGGFCSCCCCCFRGSRGNVWQLVLKIALPLWWFAFVVVFWATILTTASRCEQLLPECFLS